MNRFYVKRMVEMNPVEMTVRWGVFQNFPENTGIHCKDPNANLIVWTYSELAAMKIAEILEVDAYTWENIKLV